MAGFQRSMYYVTSQIHLLGRVGFNCSVIN